MPCATVCWAACVDVTTVRAENVAPQSADAMSFTVVPLTNATTTRPHVPPALGAGGWTSVTAPVPADVSGVPTGADQVAPPSVDFVTNSWFAGVDAVFV